MLVPLSGAEFDLLLAFAEHPQRVLSREQLLDFAHGRDHEVFDRSIDVQVSRLRRKLDPHPETPMDRRREIELWWHPLCDEMAFHQQQAEISRLQKVALRSKSSSPPCTPAESSLARPMRHPAGCATR